MTARTPLDTLIEEARHARDAAGRMLADERRTRQQTESQLEALNRYRREYNQRLQRALRDGIEPAALGNYRVFLRSLDDAIGRARQVLDEQDTRVSASQRQWLERQQRLSCFDTLAGRRAERQRRLDVGREQHRNDEASTVMTARDRLLASQQDN